MDARYLQAHREAGWSLLLALLWVCTWLTTAYLGGNQPGWLGFPRWFEWSCLFAPLLFILLCIAMVRGLFKSLNLEEQQDES